MVSGNGAKVVLDEGETKIANGMEWEWEWFWHFAVKGKKVKGDQMSGATFNLWISWAEESQENHSKQKKASNIWTEIGEWTAFYTFFSGAADAVCVIVFCFGISGKWVRVRFF